MAGWCGEAAQEGVVVTRRRHGGARDARGCPGVKFQVVFSPSNYIEIIDGGNFRYNFMVFLFYKHEGNLGKYTGSCKKKVYKSYLKTMFELNST